LDSGQIVKMGPADKVVRDYEEAQLKHFDESSYIVERHPEEVKNSRFHFHRVEMLNTRGEYTNLFRYKDTLELIAELTGEFTEHYYTVAFRIFNELGQLAAVGESGAYHGKYFNNKVRKVRIEIGPLILTAGKYRIVLIVKIGGIMSDTWENAIGFTISESQPFRAGREVTTAAEGACVLQHSFSPMESLSTPNKTIIKR